MSASGETPRGGEAPTGGGWWWDGQQWRPLSDDGHHWWDGFRWQPVAAAEGFVAGVEAVASEAAAEVRAVEVDAAGEARRAERAIERDPFRTWVAVLIAVTSVFGAIVAWQASNTASDGSTRDHTALEESAQREQLTSDLEAKLDEDLRNMAQYREHLRASKLLKDDADAVRLTDPALALQLDVEALNENRLVRSRLLQFQLISYADIDAIAAKDTPPDHKALLDAQLESNTTLRSLDPEKTARDAKRLHNKANQLVALVTLFVAALLFLTIAQFARPQTRVVFAGAGVAVDILALALFAIVALVA